MAEKADTMLLCENIITMDDENVAAPVSAIAVKGEDILAVGTFEELRKYCASHTKIFSYGDRCILPGFIESHTHPLTMVSSLATLDISGFTPLTKDEVYQMLSDAVKEAEEGEWIIAMGYNPMLVEGIVRPDMDNMNKLAPKNPLLILASNLHSLFANQCAFDKANIPKDVKNPKGGEYVRDKEGKLTGQANEMSAMMPLIFAAPQISAVEGKDLLEKVLNSYAERGYTTIVPATMTGSFAQARESLEELAMRDDCPVRVAAFHLHENFEDPSYIPEKGDRDGNFWLAGVKFLSDGSPYNGSMAVAEPFLDTEMTRDELGFAPYPNYGRLTYQDTDQLLALMTKFADKGYQIITHSHGERAVDQILDVYESILKNKLKKDHRFRIEHCGLMTYDQLKRAKAHGVNVTIYLDHIYYFGKNLKYDIFGKERASRFAPIGWADDLGHKWSLHSDSPCTPIHPWRTLQCATTRMTRTPAEIIGGDQAVSLSHALRAYTTHAAYQIFQEDKLGKIKAGYRADFTIVDRNPFAVPNAELENIKVVRTIKNGKKVALYKNEQMQHIDWKKGRKLASGGVFAGCGC